MLSRKAILRAFFLLGIRALLPGGAQAAEEENLAPYQMIRSLEYVQDSVVLGDHSAMEMQRFMLGAIDRRLRTADASIFEDPRNADAAMIYAMSGGNPDTLSFLVSRDIEGNFDNRVTEALRQYLNGKGALIVENLSKTAPEYKTSRMGPYLYLVLGNAASMSNPKAAMGYYDWARLMAPGTIIEEAALRRSLTIALQDRLVDRSFHYASFYARRFMTSPYASQFADLFVELVVKNFTDPYKERIVETLDFLDPARRREVYLRIARRAAIGGMQELAQLASERAQALSGPDDGDARTLAGLYSNLVDVPSTDILAAVEKIDAIPDAALSSRDVALRDAARQVAAEVLRLPEADTPSDGQPDSLTQASFDSVDAENKAGDGTAEAQTKEEGVSPVKASPEFDSFMTAGQSKLDEIDSLLKGGTK